MKVLYPNAEHSYGCDILPCCECGDMMDEDRSDAWFVCVECAESDKGLDWMWSEYINFLYGTVNMDSHATAWEAGLLNRQCSEFIAFHIGGHYFER